MLSNEENRLLTESGADTPMGGLMRRYWIPALLSSELPPPDCTPVRVTLLGEDLVAFRDTDGRIGLLDRHCAHRGASLFFGRNEECGLRCVYHGWKYDVDGRCVDMPNEPEPLTGDEASADRNHEASPLGAAPRRFKTKVTITAYPCVERGGVIWTYMGPPELKPGVPELEWSAVPEPQRFHSKRLQECNWLQAMEGGIDSSHISFLHSPLDHTDSGITGDMDRVSFGVGAAVQTGDRAPRFEVVDTDYGALIGARRIEPDGRWHWRITQYLLPFHTMPPAGVGEKVVQSHIWVPMDDTHVVNWMVTWHTERPLTHEEIALHVEGKGAHVCDYSPPIPEPYGDVRTAANRDNDYFMDWEAHRTRMYCGIPGFGVQDQAIQESQGPIVNRANERLGTSDAAIIRVRRRLMSAARALRERGAPAPGLEAAPFLVRSASLVLPPGSAWLDAALPLIVVRPGQPLTVVPERAG